MSNQSDAKRPMKWRLALGLLASAACGGHGKQDNGQGMDAGAREVAGSAAGPSVAGGGAGHHASAAAGTGGGGAPTDAAIGGRSPDSGSAAPVDAGAMSAMGDDASTSTSAGAPLCETLGWCELKDTQLGSVCPDPKQYPAIQADQGCNGVIEDWSGGLADTKRNRLLIWGGGHHGYFGNELYALDLNSVAMQLLDDPSDITGVDLNNCTSPEAYADGRPSSRHTYDGLTYLVDTDQLYTFAGAGIPCGYGLQSTWTLDLANLATAPAGKAAPWTNKNPSPYPTKAGYGLVSDYDPASKDVILNDGYNLWSYDARTNLYVLLNDSQSTGAHIDYHMTGRIDPKRKLFIVIGGGDSAGGGLQVFDISSGSDHAQQDWTKQVTSCDALLNASSPGLAYDEVQDRLVGWAGGNDVYLLNPDAKSCTKVTFAGGPGAQTDNGTFGRFRYFAALNVFAVVTDYHANAFTLRLTKGGP